MSIADVTETGLTLGAADITAMKHADVAVFRVHNGVALIEVTLNGPSFGERRIYTRAEQMLFPLNAFDDRSRVVEVEGTLGHTANAVTVITASRFCREWTTIVNLLHPRDRVSLRFTADLHTTSYLSEHGLHADTLHIVVHRGRNTEMTFLLDVRVSPDNSARMVRAR